MRATRQVRYGRFRRGIRFSAASWKVRIPWLLVIGFLACASPAPEESDATLRIYLARHGRTAWNAERRLQGQSDPGLDDTGRRQALQLAEFMGSIPLDAVYSSTLRRSRETAETVAGAVAHTSLAGLREQQLGKFEGLRLAGEDTALVAEFWRRIADPNDTLDGGESAEQLFQRVRQTLATIRQRHPSGSILIVGHGGTNQMILRSLMDLTMAEADSIHQANDEIYLIELAPETPPRLWKRLTKEHLNEL